MTPIETFLLTEGPLFDVRSPREFAQGRLPGATNLPLFSDQERAEVGTLYKKAGAQEALLLGLRFVGPKLESLSRATLPISLPLRLYCWRGGMRSQSVQWLLQLLGHTVKTLPGGYKAFRRWVQLQLKKPRSFRLVTGLTGCGKTAFLHEKRQAGEAVLDLEALAHHRGSAFGAEDIPQPSYEEFENRIAWTLFSQPPNVPIWIEDESRMIGACKIPDPLFAAMQQAPAITLSAPLEERIFRLVADYSQQPVEKLIESTRKLTKKLGSERAKAIEELLYKGHWAPAARLLLTYYDSCYRKKP